MNGDDVQFSSGYFVTVELLRDTAYGPAFLAEQVNLPVDTFLAELDRWAQGMGLPYGITVDRDAQTISAVPA